MTTRHRITTSILVAAAVIAVTASSALARPFDLNANGSYVPAGSPSMQSQAPATNKPQNGVPSAAAVLATELPGSKTATHSQPTIVRVSTPASGFDWGDAGIGAAGVFGLLLIGVGGAVAVTQRRGRRTHGTARTS